MKRNEKHPIPRAALMVLGLISQALVAQTVCAPSGLYGNSGGAANWVTVGTACGTQVPGSGRLQVQGADLTSINYALNTYMPAALNKMNYVIHALVGDELANSGQSSTGGYFESYGGTNNITGVETRSLLNHNSGISSINVVGVRSSAESRKALPGSYIHGVTADAKVATGGSAFEVNGVFGGTSGAGTITNAAGLNGLIYSGPNYTNCFGTRGEIQSATAATSSYGAYGISRGGTTRFGVYGEATNAGTFTRLYGVYGRAPMLQSPPVNNWGSVTSWAGYFDGHVQVVGSFTSSDRKLKTDVQPFEGVLELLQRLQPKSYRFDCAKFPGMNLPANRQIGLIAQEVEEVLPELVMATSHPGVLDEKGNQVHPPVDYLTLNYVALIPVLISGVKEQQELIDEQRADLTAKEAEIEMLKRRMESLERRTDGVGAISIEPLLPGLDQNIPNPFNETTVIKYFVPEKAENATILISSLDGKVARSFERLPAGRGQVVISAFSLAPGEYTYSMVIDGVQIASKTMVIAS